MADAKVNQKTLQNLQNYFRIGFQKSAEKPIDQIFPTKFVTDSTGHKKLERDKFPDEVQKLFQFWVNDTHSKTEDWKNRVQLYQDMDMLYYNMAMLAKAMEIMSDEVVQADTNMQPIFLEAKPKVKKFILDWFDKVGIFHLVRPTVLDIVRYGNAGWILGFDDSGINEVIPISVYDLKDRLEFTPDQVEQQMKGNSDIFFSQFQAHDRIQQLITSISDKENICSEYRSYLFGFQVNENIIPPWRLIHFRNFTTSSPFKPFGVPVFIHSVAPYRQWDAAMTMQIVARGAKFPKEVYKLKISNAVDPSTKLDMAVTFLNELLNSGIGTAKKELPGVNEIRISIDELFEWSQETPDIDLGKIDDIQMLLDEVANSTFLPKNLIDPRDSGFGESGFSYVEKFKPFARLVFRIQSIFLANLTQAIKIHMIHSGQFSLEEMDFVLSMPYPESQINPEIINSQTSQWDLANNIIHNLSDKLLAGDPLPTDIIKQIYQKVLPYDDETIDNFVKGTLKGRGDNDVKEYSQQLQQDADEELEKKAAEQEKSTQEVKDQQLLIQKDKLNLDRQNNQNEKDKIAKEKEKIQSKESYSTFHLKEELKAIKKWKLLEKRIGRVALKEEVANEILQVKQETLREGILKGNHFFSSKNRMVDFPAEQLVELDKKRLERLKEIDNQSIEGKIKFKEEYYKEEVPYTFKSEISDEIESN